MNAEAFLATLLRKGLAEGEFELLETDTTDPKGTRTSACRDLSP
jgi:hypothetical protein